MKARTTLAVISILYVALFYVIFKSPIRVDDQLLLLFSVLIYALLGFVVLLVELIAVFHYKTVIPLIVLFIGAVAAWYIPETTPEEIYLIRYKSDYEHVVEMARKRQIKHGGNCYGTFIRPLEYKHLTWRNCLHINYSPSLIVEFDPKRYSPRILVYAETKDALIEDASCWGTDGWVVKQINDHWYVCYQTWN